ncbi:hypothetical protein DNH61_24960 [Paenibacillus sambharensis]|uniref:Uncharacterized protein n=1 Tax=Paenibacillus sambharensis TaxID=1803190 RepID=A0A2W1KZE6_9BACL|nr:hypothetical protein [Paenibacillus sambharensis]PZD93038.1 hypothetical protein DNH61_24960 [Paenibacillus sambharensis]
MPEKGRVDWDYEGKPDFSSGTGAYGTEKALALASALVVPGFVLYLIVTQAVDWTMVQKIIALVLAVDISGGLVSNALNSCKRFYHTPPKPSEGKLGSLLKNPLIFTLFHIHPIAAGLVFADTDWFFGLAWYGLLLASALAVLMTPLYLQRPVAMLLIMSAVMINFYGIQAANGLEWLMPLLFIKIVYGHLVREEPYRRS